MSVSSRLGKPCKVSVLSRTKSQKSCSSRFLGH